MTDPRNVLNRRFPTATDFVRDPTDHAALALGYLAGLAGGFGLAGPRRPERTVSALRPDRRDAAAAKAERKAARNRELVAKGAIGSAP